MREMEPRILMWQVMEQTSHPFPSWEDQAQIPAEGWDGSWRWAEGLWDKGCGDVNQKEWRKNKKPLSLTKRGGPRSGLEQGGQTTEVT